MDLGRDLTSLAKARDFTEAVGLRAGLSEGRIFDLKVAVSEACANALEHGGDPTGQAELLARLRTDSLTIDVRSRSPFLLRSGSLLEGREHRGMGLPLMIALTDEVHVRREPDGGTVVALSMLLSAKTQSASGRAVEVGQLAHERQRAQALDRLAQQRTSELEATFGALDHPILIFDATGKVSRANSAAVDHTGFDPVGLDRGELVRRLEISSPDGSPVEVRQLPSWRATLGQPTRGQRLLITSGQGRRRLIEVSSSPLTLPGELRGAVLTWRDVTDQERLYKTQLRLAQTLQQALLTVPEEAPGVRFGHFHSSATAGASIGADFYDLFVLPGDRLGVLIGDVSGKGVEGAAAASLVKNVLKAYAYQLESPGEIMRRANDMLLMNTPSGGFTSALLAIVDLGRGVFAYSNAGHPPPLLKSAKGDVKILATGSPVLGALPDVEFTSTKEVLRFGDLLLLYTDGVTEARSAQVRDQEFFGEERLARIFGRLTGRAHEIPGLVYREVAEFSDGELTDDLALICLELAS